MEQFDPTQTDAVSRAFDIAWDDLIRQGRHRIADIPAAREILAKRILLLAGTGEKDEQLLASAAALYIRNQEL